MSPRRTGETCGKIWISRNTCVDEEHDAGDSARNGAFPLNSAHRNDSEFSQRAKILCSMNNVECERNEPVAPGSIDIKANFLRRNSPILENGCLGRIRSPGEPYPICSMKKYLAVYLNFHRQAGNHSPMADEAGCPSDRDIRVQHHR